MDLALATTEATFPAMGSTAHVVTTGAGERVLTAARAEIERLEALWSRFRGDSEISQLDRDRVARVSDDTLLLVEHVIEAWRATGGRFDPTVGGAMLGAGYDRSFDEGLDSDGQLSAVPALGCDDIAIDRHRREIRLPDGVHLDPGGLGKGLAADLVAARTRIDGHGILVNLGGDLKVMGDGPVGGRWIVEVDEPAVTDRVLARIVLPADAAVATSTPLRRTWRRGDDRAHHLIDPRTGLPHSTVNRLVTVVASDAWWAEAVTKQLIGVSPAEGRRILHDASALVVDEAGEVHLLGGMEGYLA